MTMPPQPTVDFRVLYSPYNEILDKIVNRTATLLKLNGYESVKSSAALQTALMAQKFIAGIEFNDADSVSNLINNYHF